MMLLSPVLLRANRVAAAARWMRWACCRFACWCCADFAACECFGGSHSISIDVTSTCSGSSTGEDRYFRRTRLSIFVAFCDCRGPWLFARRRGDPLDERFIHVVHGRMFNATFPPISESGLLTELPGRRFEWGRGSLVAANELRALHRRTP